MKHPTRNPAESLVPIIRHNDDDYNFFDTEASCRSLHHNYMFDKVSMEQKVKSQLDEKAESSKASTMVKLELE